MIEHDVAVPAGNYPDGMSLVNGLHLVDVGASHHGSVAVEFYLFQFVSDILNYFSGLWRRDAPPVAEVLVGCGTVGCVELSEEGFESFLAGRQAPFAEPLVWPREGDLWALAGTEDEASLEGCGLEEAAEA